MNFDDCSTLGCISVKQELLQSTYALKSNEVFYHYTSRTILNKIMTQDGISLRLTRTDLVNDYSEKKNIIVSYKNICEELLKREAIDRNFYNEIINLKPGSEKIWIKDFRPQMIIDAKNMKTALISEYKTYIVCFSKNKDSLPMWNYYVKDNKFEGVNIGFSPIGIRESIDIETRGFVDFLVVEYDYDEKKDILYDLIYALYSLRSQDDNKYNQIKNIIIKELSKWESAFKSECFEHEEEVRIAIHLPVDNEQKKLLPIDNKWVKYDDSIIPEYIYFNCNDKSVLKQITLPPSTTIVDKYFEQLNEAGYSFKVSESQIPVRF